MAGLTLYPYKVWRPPLHTMSVCPSNRLKILSEAGTVSPCSARRTGLVYRVAQELAVVYRASSFRLPI